MLAIDRRAGRGPTFVFLPGYASDRRGTKALALDAWAASQGRACVRFDWRGCGDSSGDFAAMTLDDWLADTLHVIDTTTGPLVLVGSSMGGWVMLLAALARRERIAALVGIAAAPDFTDWGFTDAQEATLIRDGRIEEPSPYGAPLVTTRGFWESGARHRVLGGSIDLDVPVRLLHGQRDDDVPWQVSLDIAARLRSPDVQVTLVKDGDHRLSRAADIALLTATIAGLEI